MMFVYIVSGVCVLVLLFIWSTIKDPLEPPELPGRLPVIGHSLLAVGDSVDMFNIMKKLSLQAIEFGGVVKGHLGIFKIYGVADPEDCLTVLNECIEKSYMFDFMKPMLANGLLVADAPTWKKHRKLLNPSFSQQVLEEFIWIFNNRAEYLVTQFSKEVGKPFDHELYFRLYSLESICATSLGLEDFENLQKEYLPYLHEVLYIFNTRMKSFWLHSDTIFNFTSLKKKQDKVIKRIHDFTDEMIKKTRAETEKYIYSEKTSARPLIYRLLELAKENPTFTDEQIRGEVNTFIFAGEDTLASTLTFALTLLGSHPNILNKAYEEILEVMGDSNSHVEKEDLSKLVYIEAIIKETLRLYPSAPFVLRQVNKDIKLRNCTLKSGFGCVVSLFGAMRHPIWGPDQHEFRPERWFDKDTLPPSKYFAPFAMGRRFCIGKLYALTSMKIALTHVIRRYHITSDVSKMVVKMEITIKPERGHFISLIPRE